MPTKSEKDSILLEQINKSKSIWEIDITDNQERYKQAWLYHEGKLPEPYDIGLAPKGGQRPARIGYVENVLKEAERKLTPAILSIFTENDSEAVIFRGKGFKRDPFIDQMINAEINEIFLRRNDGYMQLENIIKEALVAGNGFGKVFVEEEVVKEKLPIDQWMPLTDLIAQLSQNVDEEGTQWHIDLPSTITTEKKGKSKGLQWRLIKEVVAQGPTGETIEAPQIEIKGTANIFKTIKHIKFEQVDFKDLIVDTSCGSDFDKCRYICHKKIITVGEAISMGFDEEQLKNASMDNALSDAALSKLNLLTHSQFNADLHQSDYSSDPMERKITLYEHYVYSSIPTGKTELYQVVATQTEILDYKQIPAMPFINGRVDNIPGSFWGAGLYDTCKHYQDILSDFARVATQKAIRAAFPTYVGVKGQYDRESLMNCQRPGSVVEVMSPGAIDLMLEPQVPQEMFSIMQYMTNSLDKKTSTAVGALSDSNGDMPENVSGQSVAMMISNEGLKDKVYAKAIARTCIRPLFEKLYDLIRAEGITIVTTQGNVTSDKFPTHYGFTIDINTSNDKLMQSRQLANAYQVIAQIAQANSPVISPTNLVAAGAQLLEGSDLDASQFFTDPSAAVTPEQQQSEQAEAENDKILAHNAKMLAYQSAIATYQKTLAEIAEIEAKTDEHVKSGHAKREIQFNESLLKAAHHQTESGRAAADAKFKQDKIELDSKAVNSEIILKSAQIANPDVNGIRI